MATTDRQGPPQKKWYWLLALLNLLLPSSDLYSFTGVVDVCVYRDLNIMDAPCPLNNNVHKSVFRFTNSLDIQ